ncbi:hypothetical protein [uncultured Aquimarina sp.]|uniref:hypothetical protein n=1 Tax=uncultured Aquimarina sp. TaxID=575652 RepID=UPI002615BA6F|nr:hypothetical protein [uncultured Aquimarina sp.]
MKKSLLNLGKALSKSEQKEISGGMLRGFEACGCTSNYVVEWVDSRGEVCSYAAAGTSNGSPFPGGRCLGRVQNGMCCPEY